MGNVEARDMSRIKDIQHNIADLTLRLNITEEMLRKLVVAHDALFEAVAADLGYSPRLGLTSWGDRMLSPRLPQLNAKPPDTVTRNPAPCRPNSGIAKPKTEPKS